MWDSHPEYGLGSNGSATYGNTVLDGAFSSFSFPSSSDSQYPSSSPINPPPFSLRYPVPHFLRRKFNLHPIDQKNNLTLEEVIVSSNVRHLVQETTPNEFFHDMEASHNLVHKFIGGDLEGVCPTPVGGVGDYLENTDDELGEEIYELWKDEKSPNGACEGGFTPNGTSGLSWTISLFSWSSSFLPFTFPRSYIL